MYYKISTLPGQSGAGIIARGIVDCVIGIHLSSHPKDDCNFGRSITKSLVERLDEWALTTNAQSFWLVDMAQQSFRRLPSFEHSYSQTVRQLRDRHQ